MTNEEIDSLVKTAQDQHPFGAKVLEPVIEYFYPKVSTLVRARVFNKEDAGEIVQEVFLRMHRSLHQFRFDSSFRAWLYKIAVNATLTYNKRHARQESKGFTTEFAFDLPAPDFESDTEAAELRNRQVHEALDGMGPKFKQVIWLHFFEKMTLKEIAVALNLSESAVKMRLSRAKEQFARIWNG